jgi:hypothetical protein
MGIPSVRANAIHASIWLPVGRLLDRSRQRVRMLVLFLELLATGGRGFSGRQNRP